MRRSCPTHRRCAPLRAVGIRSPAATSTSTRARAETGTDGRWLELLRASARLRDDVHQLAPPEEQLTDTRRPSRHSTRSARPLGSRTKRTRTSRACEATRSIFGSFSANCLERDLLLAFFPLRTRSLTAASCTCQSPCQCARHQCDCRRERLRKGSRRPDSNWGPLHYE